MALWASAVLVIGWWIAISSMAIFGCNPIPKFWYESLPGHCIGTPNPQLGTTIPNVITDLILLLSPMSMLWRLNVPIARRITLFGVFLLGYW